MNNFIKVKNKYQQVIERNFLMIQLYFSIAFITFLYLVLDGTQENILIAFLKGLFWPLAAFLALLF